MGADGAEAVVGASEAGTFNRPERNGDSWGAEPAADGLVNPEPSVELPLDTGEIVELQWGELNIVGDPILYDAFEGYGTSELRLLRQHASWPAVKRATHRSLFICR